MTPTDISTPDSGTVETAAGDRENALAPYLAQLASAGSTDAEVPSSIAVEGQSLPLEAWDREVLRKHKTGVDSEGHPWPSLVPEGLAFGAKCLLRAQQHETDGSAADQDFDPVNELIVEAAAGVAILEELQSSVDELIRAGRMTEAKPLTAFRNRVRQSVDTMRKLIGGQAFVEAEAMAKEMAVERPMAAPPTAVEEEKRRSAPTQFKKDAKPVHVVYTAPAKQRRQLWILLAVLFVSVAVWIGLTLTQPRYVAPPELTLENFRHVPAVRTVRARPPSLFITLNPTVWNDMSAADRLEAIREIGNVANPAGYAGVQLWTADGAAAGRWLKKNGAQLIRETSERR